MLRAARQLEPWLVLLGLSNLLAWLLLAIDPRSLALPAFCTDEVLWTTMPLSASLDLALVFNSPAQLISGWTLMVVAMMSPLIVAPLRRVRERSFARRRARAMLLFVAGYMAVWMIAGLILQSMALALRWAVFAKLACVGLAVAIAIVWQVAPAKQWCMNRCHRRPPLAAFGAAANRDAFEFGLTNGVACVGTCWALMWLTLFVGQDHILAMIAVTLFIIAERLDSPGPAVWAWRVPNKALRLVSIQARMRLGRALQ
jgi:predicted metal-binding membrane protein